MPTSSNNPAINNNQSIFNNQDYPSYHLQEDQNPSHQPIINRSSELYGKDMQGKDKVYHESVFNSGRQIEVHDHSQPQVTENVKTSTLQSIDNDLQMNLE